MKHRISFDRAHHIAAARNIVMESQYPTLFTICYNDLTKIPARLNFIPCHTFFTPNVLSTISRITRVYSSL